MVELIDVVLEGFKQALEWITAQFIDGLNGGYQQLSAELFGTPTPETNGSFIFGVPSNAPWPQLRDALVGGEVTLLALLILVVCVQARHTLRIFNVGSAYAARRTSKTAWVGAMVVVMWYWIGSVSLYLVEALTIALLPSVQSVATAMTSFLTVSISNPALAFVVAAVGGLSMWALEAFLYIRHVLLYVYLYGMPIAVALAYGNVPVVADIADGFCRRFIPLALLPLPAAVVFRGYDLLYGQGILSPTTVYLQFLVAASLPVVAVVLSWKTFQYATPLTSRVLAATTRTVGTVGAVAVGGSVAGPTVARTVAYRGARQAAKRETVRRVSKRFEQDDEHQPRYRRTKNDP
ncbi:hypothetical protein [Halogranum gelatinilyticum]|uniref:hypothetical protein n=1 Tax=Halogranum gelatinilyticum TaxID=660521 RepID=UPI000B7F4F87|nr:hypothetical protein [Halogranum gelatinilyticum]